jgi:hypothetical protein
MNNQLNYINILIKMFTLIIFWNIIRLNPQLNNYNDGIKFNVYRSLMCISFTILSLYNTINNIKLGFNFPFRYHTDEFNEIHDLFIAYLTFDIIKLIKEGNKRIDLYIHHIWCLASFVIAKLYNHCGMFHNFILFNEIISVVSGIDSMAMNDNKMDESLMYKKIRKNIIKYIRLPIWIILLVFTIKYTGKVPKILWYNGILTTLLMIFLDRYWERKCDKVINKYK